MEGWRALTAAGFLASFGVVLLARSLMKLAHPATTVAVLGAFLCWFQGAAADPVPATVVLGELEQTYDGTARVPSVTTDPPGLAVTWSFQDLQPVSETVYNSTPNPLDLSYGSVSYQGTGTFGIGDHVQLAGSARNLVSVDVVMVTWAKAENYPEWAAADPTGWKHPVWLTVYDGFDADGVPIFREEVMSEVFVPWRPLTLSDGSPYIYNGRAFVARFFFPDGLALSAQPIFLVTFDTQTVGFFPIGVRGPYNELNVAVGGNPTVGSDVDPTGLLWLPNATDFNYPVDIGTPMFVVRANGAPAPGTPTPPVEPGHYRVTATVADPLYAGEATAELVIRPIPAELTFENLTQIYDGSPKPVSVATEPAGVAVSVRYNGSLTPPSGLGKYLVMASSADPHYSGAADGWLWIGHNLESWLKPWIDNGTLDPAASGAADDPDGDGVPNLLEYAYVLNPVTLDHGTAGTGKPSCRLDGDAFSVTYRLNPRATDLVYQIEATAALGDAGSWQAVATTDAVVSSTALRRTIRATLAELPGAPRRFARLRVSRQ